jgi:hypothetical protein
MQLRLALRFAFEHGLLSTLSDCLDMCSRDPGLSPPEIQAAAVLLVTVDIQHFQANRLM